MRIARIALIAALAFAPAAFAAPAPGQAEGLAASQVEGPALSSAEGLALSAVEGETPSAMLEKGIFQEETAGDLAAAVKIYRQIVYEADAARHAVAEAQYRLGVCYEKQGKKDEAQAAFQDLVAKYPDETDLVAEARKELGGAAPALTAKYEPLELDPAPWPDDELMIMSIKSEADVELGMIYYTAKRLDSHGRPITPAVAPTALSGEERNSGEWRIESYQMVAIKDWRQFTRVDADAMTFAPMTGLTKNNMGAFRASYRPGEAALEVTRDGKTTTLKVPVAGTVYDNEQMIYLLRRLPLKEGYTARFPIFPVTGGAPLECRIRVEGRENVFDCGGDNHQCWKVALTVFNLGVEDLQQELWIEAGGSHLLVKYDTGTAVLQLMPIMAFSIDFFPMTNAKCQIMDEDEIIIKRAPGWLGYCDRLNPNYRFRMNLLSPELKAWAVFVGKQRPADMDARKIAEGDVAILDGFFENYVVRADSWSDVTVSGLKGVSFVADYQDNGRAMVEYRTYLLTPTMVLWFVFRVDKDQFDASRPAFDKLVQSLEAPGWMSGPDAGYLTICLQAIVAAAALPPEAKVECIRCRAVVALRPAGVQVGPGWEFSIYLPAEEAERLVSVLKEPVKTIGKATIFPERIPFVNYADFNNGGPGFTDLTVYVITRAEAEKRRAAAHVETK